MLLASEDIKQKQNERTKKERREKRSLDLLWANLRVQHHLPPLDLASNFFVRVQLTSLLLISPGLCAFVRTESAPLNIC